MHNRNYNCLFPFSLFFLLFSDFFSLFILYFELFFLSYIFFWVVIITTIFFSQHIHIKHN